MVRIGVLGAAGRMGRSIVLSACNNEAASVGAAMERSGSGFLGSDAGLLAGIAPIGVLVSDKVEELLDDIDLVIDFTTPASTMGRIGVWAANAKPVVIGTTGFTEAELNEIDQVAERIPVLLAPNMSVGVNLMLKLLEKVTTAIGNDYDIEIVEAHHKHKKDAPSGTAVRMGEVMASALGSSLNELGVYERHGMIGERTPGSIGMQTVRAGDIVGDHTVMFCGNGERLEISHKAESRMIFANGAVKAAIWLAGRKPGRYDMGDLLELDKLFG